MTQKPQRVILTYHGIGNPPDSVPVEERPYWIQEQAFVDTMEQLAKASEAHDISLTVTFDDGNKSDILIGAPTLKTLGIKAIFFPCAGRLGQSGYLDSEDLRSLVSDGFEIGSHGKDHLPWATLKGDHLQQETSGAKKTLEAAIGQPVLSAALPFGSYNRRALAAARNAGYRKLYSSDQGLSGAKSWFVRRFSYRNGISFDLVELADRYSNPVRNLKIALKHTLKAMR